jgi:hypothetical protein
MLPPMSNKRLVQIERRIEKIKAGLQKLGAMRPGSLTRQFRNPKEQTREFFQLSYTHQMKSRSEYIRPEFVTSVRMEVDNYKLFRRLVDEWVALGIEYSRLRMKLLSEQGENERRRPRKSSKRP